MGPSGFQGREVWVVKRLTRGFVVDGVRLSGLGFLVHSVGFSSRIDIYVYIYIHMYKYIYIYVYIPGFAIYGVAG